MKQIIVLFFAASLLACANHKKMTTPEAEIEAQKVLSDYFVISQGGGFTGAYETYLVQKDGKIIQLGMQSDSTTYGAMAPETADSLFAALPSLGITERAISPAGNMNYSITTFINGTKKTLSWADMAKPNDAILNFYKFALLEIKKPRK